MRNLKTIVRYLLSLFFVLAGINHFINTAFYVGIMPPYLPWHLHLVLVSGFFEIAFGLLILFKTFRRVAAWGLILLLIAVFPANINMAINHQLYPQFSFLGLLLRLPIQVVFIALAYWNTVD